MNPYYDDPADVKRWLADRRLRLHASEVAAVIGISPYGTALDVYAAKTDDPDAYRLPEEPTDDMRWGHLYEPVIARAYEVQTGERLTTPGVVVHPSLPWLAATPDRINEASRPVELKKVRWNKADLWGPAGTDLIPEFYLVQVHIQIAALDADAGRVAALIGEDDLRAYGVERNPRLERLLVDLCGEFWDRVERRDPPAPDWQHPATPELLNRLHRPRPGTVVNLDAAAAEAAATYHVLGQAAASIKRERDAAKARLLDALGTAETGLASGWRVTRKEIRRDGYAVEPTTYPDLRVKPLEGKNDGSNTNGTDATRADPGGEGAPLRAAG